MRRHVLRRSRAQGYQELMSTKFSDVLTKLGFDTYEDYLQSSLWRNIRAEIFHRDKLKCRVCGNRAKLVHHQRYDIGTMQGKQNQNLVSMCHRCHEQAHYDVNGNRLDMGQTRKWVKLAIKGKPKPTMVDCSNPCRGCGRSAKEGRKFCRLCQRRSQPASRTAYKRQGPKSWKQPPTKLPVKPIQKQPRLCKQCGGPRDESSMMCELCLMAVK